MTCRLKNSYTFWLSLFLLFFHCRHVQIVSSSADDSNVHLQTNEPKQLIESLPAIDEQEQLDTIVRAFKHLPAPEIERLGVNVDQPIIVGTERAEMLKLAWIERQRELKIALSSIVKPAEHMGKIIERLVNLTTSDEDITAALTELESFLADIDNARDFHTIGGWPVLVSKLANRHRWHHRMYAAWAIGTAVKNSYDYQLWTLESTNSSIPILSQDSSETMSLGSSSGSEVTCIQYLVEIMGEQPVNGDDSLQKRALYAISAAARGNTEVQMALLQHRPDQPSRIPFLKYLYDIAISNTTSPELSRKIWALVSDMMEERNYIRFELAAAMEGIADKFKAEIDSFRLLGDEFCKNAWTTAASFMLQKCLENENFHFLMQSLEDKDVPEGGLDADKDVVEGSSPATWFVDSVSLNGEPESLPSTFTEDEGNIKLTEGSVKKSLLPLRATLSSLLKTLREFKVQCPESFEGPVDYLVTSQAQRIASLQANVVDDIVDQAVALLAIDSSRSKSSKT